MRGEVVVAAGEGDVDELLVVAHVLGQLEEALVVVVPLEQQLLVGVVLGLDLGGGRGQVRVRGGGGGQVRGGRRGAVAVAVAVGRVVRAQVQVVLEEDERDLKQLSKGLAWKK